MNRLLLFAILAIGLVYLSLAFAADPGVSTESTTDAQGRLMVRSVIPGQSGLPQEVITPENPFDQETLWQTEDPIAIANNVDMSGDGQSIVVGWWLNSMRTSRYATIGAGTPVWEYPENVNFFLPVSSSDNGNVMASCGSQVPLNVWLNGAGPNPSWSYTAPDSYNWVDVDVSDNGVNVVAVCKWLGANPASRLLVFTASSGTLLWQSDFTATNGVNGVEISEDNGWVVVSGYSNFFVYQMSTQSLFFTGPNYSQTICGIDDDAEYLAEGDFYGVLHLYRRIGSAYVQQWQNSMGGWITSVDISSDGSTVIAGNFNYSPTNSGLVRGFSIDGTVRFTYSQYGDYVASVMLCNNGSVGVAGSWGQLDATYGDVFTAFDMSTGTVIYRLLDDVDEPGSIFAVAIADNGAYATAGGKAVHARTFGNGGQTYSFELVNVLQNIDITMTPINPPIMIPQNGGSFQFNITVTNNATFSQSFAGWIMVQLPGGQWYGPVLGPQNLTLAPGQSLSRIRVQTVPGNAPGGTYTMRGYVGTYPSVKVDSSSFNFAKAGVSSDNTAFSSWTSAGEIFPSEEFIGSLPAEFGLMSTIPNPFNPSTVIRFHMPEATQVSLKVYDTAGRLVSTLVNGWREVGTHEVTFDGQNLSSGIYLYTLTAGQNVSTGKMVLLK
jgi:hypothetical protein